MSRPILGHHPKTIRQRGLTLIEAMITLAVAAILLTLAVPSLQDFIIRNRMSTEVNNFIAALYVARSEAVKRLRDVSLCPTTTGTSCAASTDWAQGWMVYADIDNSNDFSPGDVVIQQNSKMPFNNIGNITFVTFNSRGSSNAGSFSFTDTNGVANPRCVTLSSTGRLYVSPAAC